MDDPINKDLTTLMVNKQYRLAKKLGAGAFGEIYLALKGKEEYAIKLEKTNCKFPQVFFEAKLYSYLQGDSREDKGIPRMFGSGTEGEYNYMVMDVLGKSLEDLFNNNGRKLSLKTTLMIADQMITRIEFIHSKSFIHRDIKPDNFLMGIGSRNYRLYIVDFGLAKRYLTKEGHIPYKENKSLTGTVRYASINTHLGIEQSRRDDLEGLGYVLVYLAKGVLPWMNLRITNQNDKYRQIMEKKMSTTSDVLCKGLPAEFTAYMNYVKALKFEEKPDYVFLRGLFQDVFKKNQLVLDYRYDWTKAGEKVVFQQVSPPPKEPPPKATQSVKQVKITPQPAPQLPPPDKKAELQKKNALPPAPQAKRPASSRPLPRQQSAKKPEAKLPAPFQKQIMAPRIVINKEPYCKG